jgi:acylphosphatase
MIKSCSIEVIGKVQGVGFRYSAMLMATSLGIKGTVKNTPNGSVYIEAVGNLVDVTDFIEWCKKGPQRANVVNVIVNNMLPQTFTGFEVI